MVPLCEYFGFKVVEEIVVGKGKVDGRGRLAEGDGVKAWLMVINTSILLSSSRDGLVIFCESGADAGFGGGAARTFM